MIIEGYKPVVLFSDPRTPEELAVLSPEIAKYIAEGVKFRFVDVMNMQGRKQRTKGKHQPIQVRA